jgi:hypothetical protein
MGLKALTHKSGFIETEEEELELVFEKSGDVDLSLNLSGSHVKHFWVLCHPFHLRTL